MGLCMSLSLPCTGGGNGAGGTDMWFLPQGYVTQERAGGKQRRPAHLMLFAASEIDSAVLRRAATVTVQQAAASMFSYHSESLTVLGFAEGPPQQLSRAQPCIHHAARGQWWWVSRCRRRPRQQAAGMYSGFCLHCSCDILRRKQQLSEQMCKIREAHRHGSTTRWPPPAQHARRASGSQPHGASVT